MEDLKFYGKGNDLYLQEEVTTPIDPLPPGNYLLQLHPKYGFYLQKIEDKFNIGHKIYGLETKWIERFIKTYKNTQGSIGVLFNGVKGTGKTVTSKLTANALGLPTIIVTQAFEGLPEYISKIPYDITLMFDEFEKTYPIKYDNNSDILTVMDGVLSNRYRRVWLLTTNNTFINENLLERPGRIRYHKEYNDLDRETIEEVVDDLLIHTQHREGIISFISTLNTITIDIVKAVIQEVNIHDEDPKVFGSYFNIKKITKKFNIFKVDITKGSKEIWFEDVIVDKINPDKKTNQLRVDGSWEAAVISCLPGNMYVVDEQLQDAGEPPLHFTIKIEEIENLHKSYKMAF